METPTDSPDISQATANDFDALKQLMQEANNYSKEVSGLPLWTDWYRVDNQLKSQLENGELYTIKDESGSITSAIAFNDRGDSWGKRGADGQALYFYKFMKDPVKARPGEAAELMNFVANQAIKQQKPYLRCDTTPELEGLIKYYERLGFEKSGEFIYPTTGRPGVLLEASAISVAAQVEPRSY